MKGLGKILKRTALAGGMALALAGCDEYKDYYYQGTIDGEKVSMDFSIVDFGDKLTVTRKDGTIVKYVDNFPNGSPNGKNDVNYFNVEKDGVTRRYNNNAVNKEAIKEAQKQFESYLIKIREKKQQEALDAIRK